MTDINLQRRAFLRGRAMPHRPRIPWARVDFTERCERCDDCIRACQPQILQPGDGGFPEVNFHLGGCTFCGQCVNHCRHDAFEPLQSRPWQLRIAFQDHCLSANGVTCRACGDQCDENAIRFRLQTGGRALPILDQQRCTGCGACLAPCPNNSIRLEEAA
jgi:ferredoxin-type protein NapF